MRRTRALSVNCSRLSWQARCPKRLWNQVSSYRVPILQEGAGSSPRHWEETMYGAKRSKRSSWTGRPWAAAAWQAGRTCRRAQRRFCALQTGPMNSSANVAMHWLRHSQWAAPSEVYVRSEPLIPQTTLIFHTICEIIVTPRLARRTMRVLFAAVEFQPFKEVVSRRTCPLRLGAPWISFASSIWMMYGTNAELPPIFFPRFMFQPAHCLASPSVHRSWDPEQTGKKDAEFDWWWSGDGHSTRDKERSDSPRGTVLRLWRPRCMCYHIHQYQLQWKKMRDSSYVWRQDLDGSMILRCLYQKCVGAARAFGNFGGLLRGTRHHLIPETVVTVFNMFGLGWKQAGCQCFCCFFVLSVCDATGGSSSEFVIIPCVHTCVHQCPLAPVFVSACFHQHFRSAGYPVGGGVMRPSYQVMQTQFCWTEFPSEKHTPSPLDLMVW